MSFAIRCCGTRAAKRAVAVGPIAPRLLAFGLAGCAMLIYFPARAGDQAAQVRPEQYAGLFAQYVGRPVRETHVTLDTMIAERAAANGVPVSLVRRVIMRESGYNPRAVSAGNYGLMQIRLGTARSLGYSGGAAGLLDPSTNLTYGVRYLAGAYRVAGGNESRAIALYQRGYSAGGGAHRARYAPVTWFGGGSHRTQWSWSRHRRGTI